jgi:hypothetical protein
MTRWIRVPQEHTGRGRAGGDKPSIRLAENRHGTVTLSISTTAGIRAHLGAAWSAGARLALEVSADDAVLCIRPVATKLGSRPLRAWGRHKGDALGAQFRPPPLLAWITTHEPIPIDDWQAGEGEDKGCLILPLPEDILADARANRDGQAQAEPEEPEESLAEEPEPEPEPATIQPDVKVAPLAEARAAALTVATAQAEATAEAERDDDLLAPPAPRLKAWIIQNTSHPEHRDPKNLARKEYRGLLAIANGIRKRKGLRSWLLAEGEAA